MVISRDDSVVEVEYGARGFYNTVIVALDNRRAVRLKIFGWRRSCLLAAIAAYEGYTGQEIQGAAKVVSWLRFVFNGLLVPGYWGLSAYARHAGAHETRECNKGKIASIDFSFA